MIPGWISSLVAFAADLIGWGRERDARVNSPVIVANKTAAKDEQTMAEIDDVETRAQSQDPKVAQAALDELRKRASRE